MAEQTIKQNTPKLVKASARHLRIAPRKMRLVTGMVKNMNVVDALVQLDHTPKKASEMLIKLLKSAVANAKNNFSLDPEFLYIKSISTDMGKTIKRFFPRARGSAFLIQRKMAHVSVVLEERKKSKASKTKTSLFKKAEDKPEIQNIDSQEATHKHEVKEPKQQFTVKTDEQRKMGKIQQKRRLFNRKSGE